MANESPKGRHAPRMRELREASGLSQRAVAEQLGMLAETYRLKEVGATEITSADLARLARIYDMGLRDAFPLWEPSEGDRVLAEELGAA